MSVTTLLFYSLPFITPAAVFAYSAHLNRSVALESLAKALEHAARIAELHAPLPPVADTPGSINRDPRG